MALDSKLRGCDLVKLKYLMLHMVALSESRDTVLQPERPCPIWDNQRTRSCFCIDKAAIYAVKTICSISVGTNQHISTRQNWIFFMGRYQNLSKILYSTFLEKNKTLLIYRKLRISGDQLLLAIRNWKAQSVIGHWVDDALEISESIEV